MVQKEFGSNWCLNSKIVCFFSHGLQMLQERATAKCKLSNSRTPRLYIIGSCVITR